MMKVFLRSLLLIVAILVVGICYLFWNYKLMEAGILLEPLVSPEVIPYSYSQSGHLVIQVKQGDKRLNFIVDSGASNMIFSSKKREIEFDGYRGPSIGFGVNGGVFFTDIYKVKSLEIGSQRLENLSFKIVRHELKCGNDITGILGKETMRHLLWLVEPNKMQVRLGHDLEDFQQIGGDTIRLIENGFSHHLYTYGQVDGQARKFVVDTGFNGFLTTDSLDAMGHTLKILGAGNRGLDGLSNESREWVFSNSVLFGTYSPKNKIQIMSGANLASTIGLGFLRNYNFLISWKDRMLILQPLSSQQFVSKGYGFGVGFDRDENNVKVISIVENSPLHRASILPGSVVETLNDVRMDQEDNFCSIDLFQLDSLSINIEGLDSAIHLRPFYYDHFLLENDLFLDEGF